MLPLCQKGPRHSACGYSIAWSRTTTKAEHDPYDQPAGTIKSFIRRAVRVTAICCSRRLMTEIGFYHLTRSTLAQALPRLLARTLEAGQRALVHTPSAVGLDALSTALWAQPGWLPHGSASDGDSDLQPIWLSQEAEPLNGARYLFLVEGAETDRIKEYDRVFDLFDGNDPGMVAAARARWKSAKDAGHTLVYWQQTESGWQKTA
jgi:DNA polymerase-3 subunit chi